VPSPPKREQVGVVQLTLCAESASQQLKMKTVFSVPSPLRIACVPM